MKILHVASECHPLAKTGGLADVVAALPAAQARAGLDVRVLMPAYRGVVDQLAAPRERLRFTLRQQDFVLLEGRAADDGPPVWLLQCAPLFERAGGPYDEAGGRPYADNAWRFGCFAEAAAKLALSGVDGWAPEVVHAHDWHAALVPAWLAEARPRPATVLTIHNLAYQGVFDWQAFDALGLPAAWWHPDVGEFWGQFSYLKTGLATADALTAVSPRYAAEIATPAFGCGLDGLLRARAAQLTGILNGIDTALWNPATDALLAERYDATQVTRGKAANKAALQAELGLALAPDTLLVGIVSRLAAQKGMDAVLAAAHEWTALPMQLVVLGVGDAALEKGFAALAAAQPDRIAVRIGFDERIAHRIEAASDAFLMPSRFEPCGMNQMYSMRYGTVPLVRATGGLADTVSDATAENLQSGQASGIVFADCDATAVLYALHRALALYGTPAWQAMQQRGMAQDFSWTAAALGYQRLYLRLLQNA